MAVTPNWTLRYPVQTDPSNQLWLATANLAADVDAVFNSTKGRDAVNIAPAAGFTQGTVPGATQKFMKMVHLQGSIKMTTPAVLTDTLIGTLPTGTGFLGEILLGGAAVLLGTTRSSAVVLRVNLNELRCTTTAATNEIFLAGVSFIVA